MTSRPCWRASRWTCTRCSSGPTDDGYVTLLFDDRAALPDPPPPWALADDGADGTVGWQARLDERGPERSLGLPLLVTLGRAGTSTVLAKVARWARWP